MAARDDAYRTQLINHAIQGTTPDVAIPRLIVLALSLCEMLDKKGVDATKLLDVLKNALATLPSGSSPTLSPKSKSVFLQAGRLSLERRTHHVEVSELLVALAQSESKVRDVLEELAVPAAAIANVFVNAKGLNRRPD